MANIYESKGVVLSIIIPTKNRPDLLKRAVQSVLAQDYINFEICIVDNNTDIVESNITANIVNQYQIDYPNLNWLYIHSQKTHASGARNDGIFATKGKYIAFLDDDDEFLSESLKIRVNELEKETDITLLYCAGYSLIYPYPIKMYRYYKYNKQLHKDRLKMMSCSSIIINRKMLEQYELYFDEEQSRMDDYDLCKRIIELGLKVKSIPQPLILHHLHPKTRISSNSVLNYHFKDILIKRWGKTTEEYIYKYVEGVYLWRNCFSIENQNLTDVKKELKISFNREPTLTYKLKFWISATNPLLYLAFYHVSVQLSQWYQNTFK